MNFVNKCCIAFIVLSSLRYTNIQVSSKLNETKVIYLDIIKNIFPSKINKTVINKTNSTRRFHPFKIRNARIYTINQIQNKPPSINGTIRKNSNESKEHHSNSTNIVFLKCGYGANYSTCIATLNSSEFILTSGGCLSQALCSAIGWNYENEEIWPATCGSGKYQSPINLQRHKAEVSKFSPFEFMNYDKYNLATLTNNGHSVQVVLVNPEKKPSVTGGGLPGEYIFDHLHFHWSAEHTVYSNRYSLEMHMVHYSAKYNSTAAAVASGSQQAVAVIGVLFDIMDRYEQITKSFSKPFINALRKVKNSPGTPVELTTAIAIKDFFPEDITGFYRYEGSLTTPTCDEVVIWTIFTGLGYISEEQLKEFHSIHSDHGLLSHNYRAMQELNDRIVSLRKSTYNGQKNISAHYEFILMLFLTTYFINNKA